MQNQIYRLQDGTGSILDFWIVDTNDVEPYKDRKEIVITVELDKEDDRLDFNLNEKSAKSLIKYLQESLEYITKFNEESPIIEPEN